MATPITLQELQHSIKGALTERFPLPIWVSAEISELKVNYSGHCYLELVERDENASAPRTQMRAVIWRNNYTALSAYFLAETGSQMGAGMKILAKVLIMYHEAYGLSLQITDIDPTYTIGESERERQKAIAQLKADGVWELNAGQHLSRLVQRIAIISSHNAAGYQDFSNEIGNSGYYFSLTLFDAYMQGAGAEESIINALGAIAATEEEFDAVVIIRGGGSTSDLNCFNGYRLASHVAQFPLPIIAGIGHDKDVSVVDMVAHTSLKTPTAVAVWLTERMAQIETWLTNVATYIHDTAVNNTRSAEISLERYRSEIELLTQQTIATNKSALENTATALSERCEQLLTTERNRLEALATNIATHSPSHLMRLGFAIARAGGKALNSTEGIKTNEQITIELADGEIITEVKNIERCQTKS